jgi:hypothetical protein
MSETERKRLLAELEAELRRTETALAVAEAEFEKAYAALCEYVNEHTEGPYRILSFSPGITMH